MKGLGKLFSRGKHKNDTVESSGWPDMSMPPTTASHAKGKSTTWAPRDKGLPKEQGASPPPPSTKQSPHSSWFGSSSKPEVQEQLREQPAQQKPPLSPAPQKALFADAAPRISPTGTDIALKAAHLQCMHVGCGVHKLGASCTFALQSCASMFDIRPADRLVPCSTIRKLCLCYARLQGVSIQAAVLLSHCHCRVLVVCCFVAHAIAQRVQR